MSGGGSGSNTTVSNNAPPQQYLDAYSNVVNQAQNTAAQPYQPYQGQMVAGLSPDQQSGIVGTQNAQGAAAPFINAASQELGQATQPLWSNLPQFSGDAVSQYESPYTQQVVNATQAQFDNQNEQQQQSVIGNAVSHGAWGGDRSAVAQGIVAGQQQLAQAPVIAGLENTGYQQALGEFNQQQGAQLGANEANQWLASQASSGYGNLGNEALTTGLTGANSLLNVGGLEQSQAQQQLNVPYEQYTAAQAYPFQSTGWLANISEGLGGASGGTSSTTTPGASTASQVAGLGIGTAGIYGALNSSGAFGSNNNATGYQDGWLTSPSVPTAAHGGVIPGRAIGGGIMPPDVSLSIVPGADGLGDSPLHAGAKSSLLNSTGTTSTTTGGGGQDSIFGTLIKTGADIAGAYFGGPAGGMAASALGSQVHFSHGGGIAHHNDNWVDQPEPQRRAVGGPTYGGIVAPQIGGGGSSGPTYGGIAPPQIGTGGGSNLGAVNAYLTNTAAGASHALPSVYHAPAPQAQSSGPAAPAAVIPTSYWALPTPATPYGPAGSFVSPATADVYDPWQTASQSGNSMDPGNFGAGSGSRGGIVHDLPVKRARGGIMAYAEGGTTDDAPADDAPVSNDDTGGRRVDLMEPARKFVSSLFPGAGQSFADAWHGRPAPSSAPASNAPSPQIDVAGDAGSRDAVMAPPQGAGITADFPTDVSGGEDLPVPPIPPGGGAPATGDQPQDPNVVAMALDADGGQRGRGIMSRPSSADAIKVPPDHANPWLSLADAGFSMAAGHSPHALENIGAGAAQGVKEYVTADQAAKKLSVEAEEAKARLTEADAYHQMVGGAKQQNADSISQNANTRAQQVQNTAEFQNQMMEYRRAGLDERTARDRATQDYQTGRLQIGQQNANTGATREQRIAESNRQRAEARADAQDDAGALKIMSNAAMLGKTIDYNTALALHRQGRAQAGPAPVPGAGQPAQQPQAAPPIAINKQTGAKMQWNGAAWVPVQ